MIEKDTQKKLDNSSCNSCRGSLLEKQILAVIKESATQLTPIEIMDVIHKKHGDPRPKAGTVRPLLRRLLERKYIIQPYPGAYCDKITYDVRFVPLLAHNVRLNFKVEEDLESWVCDEVVGGVSIHVCFGVERHLVSGWLSYDRGMNRSTAMLAIDRWLAIARGHLGREIKDLVLTTCEFNKDYAGLRFDGSVHCITTKVLKDTIERYYEKEDGIRHEFKVNKNMSLTQFDLLFDKGLNEINGVHSAADNQLEIKELRDSMKFLNRHMVEVEKLERDVVRAVVNQSKSKDDFDAAMTRIVAVEAQLTTIVGLFERILDIGSSNTKGAMDHRADIPKGLYE